MKRIILFFAALVLLSNVVLATPHKEKVLGNYMDAIMAYKSGDLNLTKEKLHLATQNENNPHIAAYLESLESGYTSTGQLDKNVGKEIVYSFGLSNCYIDPNDPFNLNNPAPSGREGALQVFKDVVQMWRIRAS